MTTTTPAAFPTNTVTCWCGCGGRTKSKFVQGHDSKFHSTIKKCLRGELDANAEYAKLPHDEARDEWDAFIEKQLPKEDVRNAKLAEKAAAKAKAAAEKAQQKAAALAAKATPSNTAPADETEKEPAANTNAA